MDIDVENCHSVILSQICKSSGIRCKYLNKYIKNRKEYLLEVMEKYNVTRDSAKQLFIRLLYFGTFESWCKNNDVTNCELLPFIDKFKTELALIGDITYQIIRYC